MARSAFQLLLVQDCPCALVVGSRGYDQHDAVASRRWRNSVVGGRGFIAIAAVIFGGWSLKGTVAGCMLFGTVVSFRLSLPQQGYDSVSTEFLQALPYLVTIGGMALFAHRIRPPAALTRPFLRGLK